MKGTSHLIVGATTGIAISQNININPLIVIGLTSIASVIVDIDEEHSLINKVLFPVPIKYKNYVKLLVGIVLLFTPIQIAKYIGVIILLSIVSARVEYRISLFSGIQKREYHRTIFHDPIIGSVIFIIPLIILHIQTDYMVIFLIGLFTHYLMDMLTSYGLPLYLFGFKKRLRFPIHYNSKHTIIEGIIVTCYVLAILYYSQSNKIPNQLAFINQFIKHIL